METEKDKLEKMENLYNMVVRFQQKSHEKNQKRIKISLRCLYIIPAVFLFLLLVTDSSKIIFLVLWIVSLFALAIYLITVEYMDYNLQNQMNKLEGRKNAPVDGLIEMDRFNESVDRFEAKVDKLESTVDKVTSSAKELLRPEELAAKLLGDPAASDDSHTDAANTNEGGKGE